jgi:hypothetical protein
MAVIDQEITDRYALYNGDSCEVLPALPAGSVGLSIHSPPFDSIYNYSSSERDLSNCRNYSEFLDHYAFVVREIARLTKPGRVACVHCADRGRGPATVTSPAILFVCIVTSGLPTGAAYASGKSLFASPCGLGSST